MLSVIKNVGGTYIGTTAAALTQLAVIGYFIYRFKRLGIVTPFASERTSLKEHGCSYAVAVVCFESFYRKNHCLFLGRIDKVVLLRL